MQTILLEEVNCLESQEEIWDIYKKSFNGSELKCAQNQQCYNKAEFVKALLDPEYMKFITINQNKIIAYTLTTNNLEKAKITYMNPEKYLSLFPKYAPNRIYYFTSIALLESCRKNVVLYKLLSKVAKHIDSLRGVMAFDFSRETVPDLPKIFLRILHILYRKQLIPHDYSYTKVGVQEFGALIPK